MSGRKVIPKLKRGTLSKFGYSLYGSDSSRHRALDKAVKEYGPGTVIKKLNAVAVLNKNNHPAASNVYRFDIHYIQTKYGH